MREVETGLEIIIPIVSSKVTERCCVQKPVLYLSGIFDRHLIFALPMIGSKQRPSIKYLYIDRYIV